VVKTGSNRWQLDSRIEKIPSLSPGRGTLANKRVPKPKPYKQRAPSSLKGKKGK